MKRTAILLLFVTSRALAQLPSYVPINGLHGFWIFSGNANDVSGNGHNGTVFNVTAANDRFNAPNSAYSYNGSNSYILTQYAGILGTNPRAVAFWAKSSSSAIMAGVAWGMNGTAARYEAGFNYGSPGPMLDGGNGVITYSSQSPVNDNQWHHHVMQFGNSSALNQVEIYQDAVLLTTTSNVYNGSNILNTISVFNVQFGRFDASPYHYFNGQLDDIGIWDRPLTICEINQLYTSAPGFTMSVSGSQSICPGQSVQLIASGASTYTWDTGSNSQAITVSPTVSTVYTVSGHLGTCSDSRTVAVYVQSTGMLSGPGSYTACQGQSVLLTAGGASSYTWSNGSNSSSTIVNPLFSTTFTVTGTVSQGCTGSKIVTVQVSPGPQLSVTASQKEICRGQNVSLAANGAVVYTWSPGGSSGFLLTITPTASVVYSVTGADAQGCQSTAFIQLVVMACTGLDNPGIRSLTVYPNPTDAMLNVSGCDATECSVRIFSSNGVLVFESRVEEDDRIDVGTLAAGLYIVEIFDGNTHSYAKVIKTGE